jgi:hypothetical protein
MARISKLSWVAAPVAFFTVYRLALQAIRSHMLELVRASLAHSSHPLVFGPAITIELAS